MTVEGAAPAADVKTDTTTQTPASQAGVSDSGAAQTQAAPPPAAPPAPPATILGGGEPAADNAAQQPPAAPDWRKALAGDDAKELERLGRFADQAAFYKSYRAMEARLSSGELKKPLPDNATPEQVAAWRKDNGLPEKAEGYVEKVALPNGVVLGEADKPLAASFAEMAHAKNWTQAQYNDVLSWYYQTQDKAAQARGAADDQFRQQAEDDLRVSWPGQDYRRNLNAISNLMAGAPAEVRDRLLSGRTADGRLIGNDPAIAKWLAQLSLDLNPAATVIPAGGDQAKSIDDELADIKKLRTTDEKKYWSPDIQKRELQLIEAQQRIKSRAA